MDEIERISASERLSHGDDLLRTASDKRLLVSFPKSGRTWLRFALASAKVEIKARHASGVHGGKVFGQRGTRIPADLADRPIIFLHRNPIDTAVSYFYQKTRREMPRGSWRWFYRWVPLALRGALPPRNINKFVLSPVYGVRKICAYNRMWLDHLQSRADSLVLSYEDMRADSAAGFQKLLDHMGETSVTGSELAALSEIEKMRAVEKAGIGLARPETKADNMRLIQNASSAKVRRGKVNGYFDELRPETIAKCREIAAEYGFNA